MSDRLNPSIFNDRYYHLRQLRKQIESIVKVHVGNRTDAVIVDFGCGAMPYRPLFEPHAANYVGIDLPENPAAESHASKESITSLPNAFADVVLSTQVLEHVVSPSSYLQECRRILKPDGLLLISTHGYWMYHPDPNDLWRWTGAGLRKVIEENGYRILQCEGVMGLAASGMHLLQDGLILRLPRIVRTVVSPVTQLLIALCDKLSSDADRRDDACVFIIVAKKEMGS